jgi:hypothetical protein
MIMKSLAKITKVINNPKLIIVYFGSKGYFKKIPDRKYLEILHKARMGEALDLENPQTFNEKLQWLKLNDRRLEYKNMSDKYEVRKFVASKIGEEYLIPLLGVWDKFEDIDFEDLPDKFVLKCTHDSGSAVICDKKKGINYKKLNRFFNKKLQFDYYWGSREWNYHGITPRIIAEKHMIDESGTELKDYKIFTFNGEAKIIQVDVGRFTKHERNIYTTDWELLNVTVKVPSNPNLIIDKPKKLDEMIYIAEILSEGMPHVRVDLYSTGDSILFGELTFHHAGGQEKFEPKTFELEMGNWLELPR